MKDAHQANRAALTTLASISSQQPANCGEQPCLFSIRFTLMASIIRVCPANIKRRRQIAG
jgi:hypothetical protein